MSLLLRHLEANGSLPPADLEAATRHQRSAGGSLDTALLELGLVTPLQLDEHLRAACGLPGAPVRLLERGTTRPWEHVPKDLVDIGWVIPLAHEGGQVIAAVHPDLPDAKLGALYRQIRGFSPVVAPECCLAKVAAERSGAILSPRYAMLVLDYLQALRDRDAVADEPAPPAPRPIRGPSDTNPVRPASGKSPAARPAEPRPLQAVPQDRPAAQDPPAAPVLQDRPPAAPPPAIQDRPAADAPAQPAPQVARPSAVLPATAQTERPHLAAPPASPDRKDNPTPTVAPIRRRSGPSPAAAIPTTPPAGAPTTQSQRLAAAKAALAGARERDRITEALVRAAVIIAPRVGLFGVKREGLRVLAAPTSALRLTEGLVIPLPEGGPLDGAVSGQAPLSLLTEPSLSFAVGQPLGIPCVFEPVLAGGRTVLMLYLDRAGVAFDPVERTTIHELCDIARQSLESLLRLLGWVVPSGPPEAGPGDRSPTRPHLAQGVFIPPVPTNLSPKPPAPEPPAEPRPAPQPAVAHEPAAPRATAEPAAPPTAHPAASTEPRVAAPPAPPPDLARPAAEATLRPIRSPYPGTLLARTPAELMSPSHPTPTADAPPELARTDEPPAAAPEEHAAPAAAPSADAPSEPAERPAVAEVSSDHPVARPTEVSGEHTTAGDSITTGRARGSRGGRGRAVITLVNPIRRDDPPPSPPTQEAAPATTSDLGPESPLAARFAAFAAADDSPTASPRPASQPTPTPPPQAPSLTTPEPAPAEPATEPAATLATPEPATEPAAALATPEPALATPEPAPPEPTQADEPAPTAAPVPGPTQAAAPAAAIVEIPQSLVRTPVADVAQPVTRAPSQAADIPRSLLRPGAQSDPPPSRPPATRTSSQPLVAATIPPLTRPPSQAEPLVATIPPLTRPPSQPQHGAAAPAELVATIPNLTARQPSTSVPLPVEPPESSAAALHLGSGPQAQVLPDLSEGAAAPASAIEAGTPVPPDSSDAPTSRPPSAASPAASPADAPAAPTSRPSAASPTASPADAPTAPASRAPSAAAPTAPLADAAPTADAPAAATVPDPEASPSEPVPGDSAAATAPTTALNMPNLIAPPGARPARRRASEPASEPVLVIPKTLRRSTTLTATPHPMARRAEREAPAEPPAPAPAAPAPTLSIPTSLINPRGGRRRGKNEPRPETPPALHVPRLVREADAAPPPGDVPAAGPAPETMAAAPGPIAQVSEATPPPPAVAAEPPAAEVTPEAAALPVTAAEAEPALPEHPTTDDEIDAVIEAFLHSPTDWNAGARLRALDARGLARLAARFPGPIDLANATNFPPPSAHGPLLRACVELGQAIAPHVLALLASQRPQIRFYAAFLFQELRDPRCLRPLGDLAFDPDPDVRLIATRVLESYSRVPDFLAVATRIRAELDNRDRERQLLAAEAAGTLRDTFAVPRLIDLLAVRDNNLREAALEALCSITAKHHGYRAARWRAWYADHGDESRIEWVMDGLRHRDVAVRRWAADELVRITGQRIPFPVEGDRRSRDAALRLWQEWWDSNRDEFTRKP